MAYTSISLKERDTSVKSPTSTIVQHGRMGTDAILSKSMGTFTGEVWLDVMLKAGTTTMVHVNFAPCARTNWHKHEGGQLLKVTAGSGWVCDQGEKLRKISVGDIIWCPPAGIHWHGADDGSYIVHEAISFGGIDWYEPVSDSEYSAKG